MEDLKRARDARAAAKEDMDMIQVFFCLFLQNEK